jgi:hypothetical protein
MHADRGGGGNYKVQKGRSSTNKELYTAGLMNMLLYTISKPHKFMKNQNVSFPHSGSLEHEPHLGKDPKAKVTRYRQAAKTPV